APAPSASSGRWRRLRVELAGCQRRRNGARARVPERPGGGVLPAASGVAIGGGVRRAVRDEEIETPVAVHVAERRRAVLSAGRGIPGGRTRERRPPVVRADEGEEIADRRANEEVGSSVP